ncbi:Isochorismatase hydrolase [Nadsonia fulvescens var. elongata DSM 6958]|uniref:nicotinamidase n=1 Tax=Nadsonia fulvescens var. elongata DSM 6958 TaxID=857566 RepID=A0A1E3PTG4_9ASCO|nr:Isochorismatase hydrolase [Nadsonia fulvescens var. elongata DSM 6958]
MSFRPALLIIDLQNDFLPGGSLAVPNGEEVIKPILELLPQFPVVVATKDYHPPQHISFASVHNQEAFTLKDLPNPEDETQTKSHTLWPDHCVQATHGCEFPEEFLKKVDIINDADFKPNTSSVSSNTTEKKPTNVVLVKKGYLPDREYYSAFADVWGLHQTELETFLKDNDITDLFIVGLSMDYCVKFTAIDAVKRGFKATVVQEATRAMGKKEDAAMELLTNGVEMISLEKLNEIMDQYNDSS